MYKKYDRGRGPKDIVDDLNISSHAKKEIKSRLHLDCTESIYISRALGCFGCVHEPTYCVL